MLTDRLPANATSFFEMRPPQIPHAVVPLALERYARAGHDERADRNEARQPYHRGATDTVGPIVEISPSDIVKRRTATWTGMAAEIVQATRRERIESRFCAP